jgi:hypothetical protein
MLPAAKPGSAERTSSECKKPAGGALGRAEHASLLQQLGVMSPPGRVCEAPCCGCSVSFVGGSTTLPQPWWTGGSERVQTCSALDCFGVISGVRSGA